MNGNRLKLANAPIVEAIVELDCDLPPNLSLPTLAENFSKRLAPTYTKGRGLFESDSSVIKDGENEARLVIEARPRAFQFLHKDQRQVLQVRSDGFSFNRLAPYQSLDTYYPEIEAAWKHFVELAAPLRIRQTSLRFVNRLLLPTEKNSLDLDDFFRAAPKFPIESDFSLIGFLDQHVAEEKNTGNVVKTTLNAQPLEGDSLPILLDIVAVKPTPTDDLTWPSVHSVIESLRDLKNRVFLNMLTPRCLDLFQRKS